ncbi:hypothetical protein ACFLU6_02205, partial [Acidobacteriota bacterium]
MVKKRAKSASPAARRQKTISDFNALRYWILDYANQGALRYDFLQNVLKKLLSFSSCDILELAVREEGGRSYRCEYAKTNGGVFIMDRIARTTKNIGDFILIKEDDANLKKLTNDILRGKFEPELPFFTQMGTFWTSDTKILPVSCGKGGSRAFRFVADIPWKHRS